MESMRQYGRSLDGKSDRVVFEDPCVDQYRERISEVFLAILMIFQNMYSFWSATIDADKANYAVWKFKAFWVAEFPAYQNWLNLTI